ncbi:unnamed protein product, partial [Ectocarpus sp. 6 AP-2014]
CQSIGGCLHTFALFLVVGHFSSQILTTCRPQGNASFQTPGLEDARGCQAGEESDLRSPTGARHAPGFQETPEQQTSGVTAEASIVADKDMLTDELGQEVKRLREQVRELEAEAEAQRGV